MPLEILALTELAAADFADKVPSLLVCLDVELEVLLTISAMLAAWNSAGKELSRVE